MNEETTQEEILDDVQAVAAPEAVAPAAPKAQAPVKAPAMASLPSDDDDDDDDIDDDYDDDDVPPAADDDDDDFNDDDSDEVAGPSQFQSAQRGSTDRRGGFRARRQLRNETRIEEIDYKNIEMLSKFVDPRGRILSRRKTKISAKMQRRITTAIKRARHLALLPYTAEHIRITRSGRQ